MGGRRFEKAQRNVERLEATPRRSTGASVLEDSFAQSVQLASRLRELSSEQLKILERVDEVCKELYLPEFEHYVAHKYNPETPALLKKYNLMGLTVSEKYDE
jgi:hypothetical protein